MVNNKTLDASWLNKDGKLEWINPVTNKREVIPDGTQVHVDHVLPQDAIKNAPGFNELPPDVQKQLLNDPSNLQPMAASANCSKSCTVQADGEGWKAWGDKGISADYKQYLERVQEDMRVKIKKAVDAYQGGKL